MVKWAGLLLEMDYSGSGQKYYYLTCMDVLPACMPAHHRHVCCRKRSEEGVGLARAGVIDVELRIEPGFSARATGALAHLAFSPAQIISFNGLPFERGFNIYMPT